MIAIETVRTDTFSMDFFRFGRGKETLVILPGLSVRSVMCSADAVAQAYRLLTDRYTVYVFDRRKEISDKYSIYEMARDTAAAIKALGFRKVCLLGASQGGMIAMTIAIDQPDLVEKLILCSTSAFVAETPRRTVETWIRLAKAGNAADLYLAFGKALYPREIFEQAKDLLLEEAKKVTNEDLDRFVILAEGIKDFDVIRDLKKIVCPIFLIGSRDDQVLGEDATAQLAKCLDGRKDLTLHMYDSYGHAAYDTAPDFKERVLRFLTRE